jgi:hypothetical protein
LPKNYYSTGTCSWEVRSGISFKKSVAKKAIETMTPDIKNTSVTELDRAFLMVGVIELAFKEDS